MTATAGRNVIMVCAWQGNTRWTWTWPAHVRVADGTKGQCSQASRGRLTVDVIHRHIVLERNGDLCSRTAGQQNSRVAGRRRGSSWRSVVRKDASSNSQLHPPPTRAMPPLTR